MKLVYTADETDEYDFDMAIDLMDDDQEMMVECISRIVADYTPNAIIDEIYVNFEKNLDGSKNLIKNVAIVFAYENGEYLVCRAPLYAFIVDLNAYLSEGDN